MNHPSDLARIDAEIESRENEIERDRADLQRDKHSIDLWSEYREEYRSGSTTYWKNAIVPIVALSVPVLCLAFAVMFLVYRGTGHLIPAVPTGLITGYAVAFAVWEWFLNLCPVPRERLDHMIREAKQRRREIWHDRKRLRKEISDFEIDRCKIVAQMEAAAQDAAKEQQISRVRKQQRKHAAALSLLPPNVATTFCAGCGTPVGPNEGRVVRIHRSRGTVGQRRVHCQGCAVSAHRYETWMGCLGALNRLLRRLAKLKLGRARLPRI